MPVVWYAMLPVTAMLVGGVVTLRRPPSEWLQSAILHFAAGLVFAVVGVELLPQILAEREPLAVVGGFAIGIAVMLGVRQVTRRAEARALDAPTAAGALPMGVIVGLGVDVVIDGLLLGIGFSAAQQVGLLLTGALAAELGSLGVATTMLLGARRVRPRDALACLAVLGILFWAATVGGSALLTGAGPRLLSVVLSFGVAALLFLVTEELLVEAHDREETPLLTATFFVGFLLFFVLGMD